MGDTGRHLSPCPFKRSENGVDTGHPTFCVTLLSMPEKVSEIQPKIMQSAWFCCTQLRETSCMQLYSRSLCWPKARMSRSMARTKANRCPVVPFAQTSSSRTGGISGDDDEKPVPQRERRGSRGFKRPGEGDRAHFVQGVNTGASIAAQQDAVVPRPTVPARRVQWCRGFGSSVMDSIDGGPLGLSHTSSRVEGNATPRRMSRRRNSFYRAQGSAVSPACLLGGVSSR